MSIFSFFLRSQDFFLVTASYPERGSIRISMPVRNPLYGIFPHQRPMLRWVHAILHDACATPGELVKLGKTGDDNRLEVTSVLSIGRVAVPQM